MNRRFHLPRPTLTRVAARTRFSRQAHRAAVGAREFAHLIAPAPRGAFDPKGDCFELSSADIEHDLTFGRD